MADMMSTLRALLGDNADEKIRSAMSALEASGLLNQTGGTVPRETGTQNIQSSAIEQDVQKATESISKKLQNSQNSQNSQNFGTASGNGILTSEGAQFIGQIRNMVDQISNTNDSRSNLLRSLRPFMRADRQQTIDRAIRIMNIGRFSGLFGR